MSWLDDLKVGDRVVIRSLAHGDESIDTVDAFTMSKICIGGLRFNRSNGVREDGFGCHGYLVEPTPERLAAVADRIERQGIVNEIRTLFDNWRVQKLTTDQLRRMAAIAREGSE